MLKVSASLGVAMIVTSSALHAGPVEEFFNGLDADSDGKISLQESTANAGLASYFSTLDEDENGYLTPQEFGADEPQTRG